MSKFIHLLQFRFIWLESYKKCWKFNVNILIDDKYANFIRKIFRASFSSSELLLLVYKTKWNEKEEDIFRPHKRTHLIVVLFKIEIIRIPRVNVSFKSHADSCWQRCTQRKMRLCITFNVRQWHFLCISVLVVSCVLVNSNRNKIAIVIWIHLIWAFLSNRSFNTIS